MKRLPMRKIREALRLRAEGLSGRRVVQSLSLGRATVSEAIHQPDSAIQTARLPATDTVKIFTKHPLSAE